jgi:hypothetical protein
VPCRTPQSFVTQPSPSSIKRAGRGASSAFGSCPAAATATFRALDPTLQASRPLNFRPVNPKTCSSTCRDDDDDDDDDAAAATGSRRHDDTETPSAALDGV